MASDEIIICEDVRQELHGKLSLMGVLNDDLQLAGEINPGAPVALRLAIYMRFPLGEGPPPDTWDLRVTLDGEPIVEGVGNPVAVKTVEQPLVVVANMPFLTIPRLGTLLFSVVFRRGGQPVRQLARTMRITASNPAPPSV